MWAGMGLLSYVLGIVTCHNTSCLGRAQFVPRKAVPDVAPPPNEESNAATSTLDSAVWCTAQHKQVVSSHTKNGSSGGVCTSASLLFQIITALFVITLCKKRREHHYIQ